MGRFFAVLLAVLGLLQGLAFADVPPPVPEAKAVCSLNGFFCALMDPNHNLTTVVRRRAGGVAEPLWSMSGWFRVAYISNDGEYLVTGFDGGSLLPPNYKRSQVMLSFYDRGKLIRQVRLNEILSDFGKLEKVVSHDTALAMARGGSQTDSHYRWGNYLGLNSNDHLTVELVDKKWLMFDVKSGKIIR